MSVVSLHCTTMIYDGCDSHSESCTPKKFQYFKLQKKGNPKRMKRKKWLFFLFVEHVNAANEIIPLKRL